MFKTVKVGTALRSPKKIGTETATQPGSELQSLLSQAKEKLAAGDAQAADELNRTAFQHIQQGDFRSAVAIFEVLIPHAVKDLTVYANALYAVQHDNSGLGVDPARHRRFLEACLPYASAFPSILTNAVGVYFELGEPDKVFEMLETSLRLGHTEFLSFEDDPMFKDLLEEARFQRLFAQAKNTGETEEDDEAEAPEAKEHAELGKPTYKTWEQPPQKQEAEAEIRRFFDCLKAGDLSGAKAAVGHKFNDWDSQIWSLWSDTYLIYLEDQDEEVEDDSLEGNAWRDDLSWLADLEVESIHWDNDGDRVSEDGEHLIVQLMYKDCIVDVSGDFAVEKGAAGYCVIRESIHIE